VGQDNQLHRPVIIHRAPFGSMERFCGVLIEHFAGAFPVWLSPVQVIVIPIADRHLSYAHHVASELRDHDIRVQVDDRSERMNLKIREAQIAKVPYMFIVGDKELQNSRVSCRLRTGGDMGSMSLQQFVEMVSPIIETKAADKL